MNRNKASCLQLTTAQTRTAKGISLGSECWMCLIGVSYKDAGMRSTWMGAGKLSFREGSK